MRIVDPFKFWTRGVLAPILIIGIIFYGVSLNTSSNSRKSSCDLSKVFKISMSPVNVLCKRAASVIWTPNNIRAIQKEAALFRKVKKVRAHLPNMLPRDIYIVYKMSQKGTLVVKPEIMIGLFYKESTGRWNARNPSSSAYGYGQILLRTGKWAAPKVGVKWSHGKNSGEEQIRVINWLLGYFLRRADGNLVKALQLYRGNTRNTVYSSIILAFASKIS